MSRKPEHEVEKENGERWLLTYADLITLLMIFFVVLYSMSKIDAQKFQGIAESLNKALGGGTPSKIDMASSLAGPSLFQSGTPSAKTTQPGSGKDPNNTASPNSAGNGKSTNPGKGEGDADTMSIDAIKAKLDKFATDNGIQATLVTSVEERGVVVSIQETLLFTSGSAELTAPARALLEKIATVLAVAPNQIKVEGHTDDLPINTPQFPSNWELSVIRSTNVVQILQRDGITPDRLSAAGYGEYRPIVSNATDAGRTKNRRIDLVILRTKYDLTEPSTAAPATQVPPSTLNPQKAN